VLTAPEEADEELMSVTGARAERLPQPANRVLATTATTRQ